ncbi:MAG TPA: RNA methyltransferase [Myxococcota bacterium]|nr:RNA methyltransferase [Myxococcota bacterium]
MQPVRVESLDDPRLAAYRNVRDADLRGGESFVAEGRLNVRRLLSASRFRTRSVFVTEAGFAGIRDALERSAAGTRVYLASQQLMNGVVGYSMHRGCLAEGVRGSEPGFEALLEAGRPPRLCVALEDVTNAENVGAIFRNALAFGAGAVLLTPRCVDPLYRRSIRVSMGASLRVPFARAREWPSELARLRAGGLFVVALATRGAQPLSALRLPPAARGAALVVGNEGEGLSEAALAHADVCVSIPMAAGIDSLNAGTATGIALHALAEALRDDDA